MTLKQAALATLLAGGAAAALMAGRGPSPEQESVSPADPAATMTAQAPATEAAPAPTTPMAAPSPGALPDGDEEARLAQAIAAAVAEVEADRLRLAAELAEAEAEKTRLAAALAEAEAEAARLAAALEATLAAAPDVPEAVAQALGSGPDLGALEARITEQADEIARLSAALAERDAEIAALEDERKILGDIFNLAPMTATLAAPVMGAGDAEAADLDAVLDAAKAPPPRARPTALMEGRPVAEVHFDHGMSRLSPGGADRAREAARLIAALGVTRVRLSAHADTTGRATANMRLSQNRAEAVRAMLVAEGVRPEIIEIEAHGQEADALPVATAAGIAEPLNRRVGIYVETALRTAALR